MITREIDELNYSAIFSTYFINKALVVLTTQLVEEWLIKEGYGEADIAQAKNFVYLSFSILQGSLVSGGSSLLSAEIFKKAGFSDKMSDWVGNVVGTAVSLAMDFSPRGAIKTAISNIGGITGKWCAKWAAIQNEQSPVHVQGDFSKQSFSMKRHL